MRNLRTLLIHRTVIAIAVAVASEAALSELSAQSVPAGFKVELLFKAPDIEHPSVVTCDDDGNLFVGEDPMDMRGPSTKEFDRVVFIRWDDAGRPTKTVFCENLSAVFGLIWHEGSLYVMHAPHYSRFTDTDGDGVADERVDLADGFGPPAGVFGFNDHIVTGIRLGLDSKVYVSVGDKGIPLATGSDGSQISLEGGGVVRMTLDGRQLEVVTSGTRNHLDVAMDHLDNIFTYDNTDDGLGWWTRFTHHVPTGYYGYPYDYLVRPERHLPHISEHGGGSPVGAAVYRQAAWPAEYAGNAFHCEWGKRKIQRFSLVKHGASFQAKMEDFMLPEGTDEFRPQDLCFSPDGRHMYVADWNFGGWMQNKQAGRLFRVTYTGDKVPEEPKRASNADPIDVQLQSLGHPAHSERKRAQFRLAKLAGSEPNEVVRAVREVLFDDQSPALAKIHAVWTQNLLVSRIPNYDPTADWLHALADDDPDVCGQAARALGEQRLPGGVSDLIAALKDVDAGVRMRAAIALGRLGNRQAVRPLFDALADPDVHVRFAIIQALRAINDWRAAPEYLRSSDSVIGQAALLTLTTVYDMQAVSALADVAERGSTDLRVRALHALADVHRKADPYIGGWWGTQPAKGKPSRPQVHTWDGTETVLKTLRAAAGDSEPTVRLAAVQGLHQAGDLAAIPAAIELVQDETLAEELRQEALRLIVENDSPTATSAVIAIVSNHSSSPQLSVLALDSIRRMKAQDAAEVVSQKLTAREPEVRAAAGEALAAIVPQHAAAHLTALLNDEDVNVRKTIVRVLGELGDALAVPAIVLAAQHEETKFEAQMAAARIPDMRALPIYLDAITSSNQELRKRTQAALADLKTTSNLGEAIVRLHHKNELTPAVRAALQAVFASPIPIKTWHLLGPWTKETKVQFDKSAAPRFDKPVAIGQQNFSWQQISTKHPGGRVVADSKADIWTAAYAEVRSPEAYKASFLIGSDDQAVLFVNGEQIYEYLGDRGWAPDQGAGEVQLRAGVNHIWLMVGNTGGESAFSLALGGREERFAFLYEDVPQKLDVEAYRRFAMENAGDPERGARTFANAQGVACAKCHAVSGRGGMVGPDLSGVGTKYPREELIRSVLEPSNRVADSFQLTTIVTAEGKILQGIVKSETADELELTDAENRTIRLAKSDVDELNRSTLSLMPNGLNDGMTLDDFADIIAYLESLKEVSSD